MTPPDRSTPPPLVQHPQSLHELAPRLALARGGPGRTLNIYLLGSVVLDSGVRQNRRSAARLAELRPRLACFGHGFAVTDPGRFAAAVDQLGSASS
jgi:hypothetical protein